MKEEEIRQIVREELVRIKAKEEEEKEWQKAKFLALCLAGAFIFVVAFLASDFTVLVLTKLAGLEWEIAAAITGATITTILGLAMLSRILED